ncbi:hypothetical protein OJAV_G00000340 [Oryzias javanicus]|uniref:Uncharacterized protein n=1 Tax=Oryzias javanicus TaxID=123683 RepID=A0A3S2QAD3_ORYJA|nr:hypothetical protein OJAV_G00000340 [Oryzias javanicus]
MPACRAAAEMVDMMGVGGSSSTLRRRRNWSKVSGSAPQQIHASSRTAETPQPGRQDTRQLYTFREVFLCGKTRAETAFVSGKPAPSVPSSSSRKVTQLSVSKQAGSWRSLEPDVLTYIQPKTQQELGQWSDGPLH